MNAVLSIRDLTVAYGGIEVLRDLAFEVGPGKVVGLVGESGAGKSMVGRMLAGSMPPGFHVVRGTARFGSADLVAMPPRGRRDLLGDRLTFIPQEPLTALDPLMTIGAQFGEHLGRLSVPRRERRRRIVDGLAEVELPDPEQIAARYPFQLSGGQNQRVLIAMAFASNPALVVADEPTTALDVSTQMAVVSLIRRFNRDHGTALLFITHDLRLAAHICDEVVVLYAGDVMERGPAAVVMQAPRHPYTLSLKASIPEVSGPLHRLRQLPDTMPGIGAFPSMPGCRFASRCPVADPACVAARPAPVDLGDGHLVRCSPGCLNAATRVIAPEPLAVAPPPDAPPILEIRGLTKRFPPRRDVLGRSRGEGTLAVDAVDLTVRPGEFVGIVGESGSGKSTLARLIVGLETATSGRIAVNDTDVTRADRAARDVRLQALQMVFQDPQSALNPRRTIRSLVTQAMEARGGVNRDARAAELAQETGLPADLLGRYPSELSGGQKQRVNIARALCVAPRLLVADEIVSGLDVSIQAQILNLLLDLRDEFGIAVVFISHDLGVVRYLCSRVCVMLRGRIVEHGPVSDVFDDPQHAYTRTLLNSVPPDDPTRVWPPRLEVHV